MSSSPVIRNGQRKDRRQHLHSTKNSRKAYQKVKGFLILAKLPQQNGNFVEPHFLFSGQSDLKQQSFFSFPNLINNVSLSIHESRFYFTYIFPVLLLIRTYYHIHV